MPTTEFSQPEILQCVDCKAEFELTEGEAEFFEQKGLNKPKRCPECRAKRRAQAGAQGQ